MKCPVCFSNEISKIDTYTSEGHIFCKCSHCDVFFADPMKGGTGEWYAEIYELSPVLSEDIQWHEEVFLKEDVAWKDKKILNIGCGRNTFLKVLKDKNCDITAIDINNRVVDFTKNVLGIEKAFTCDISEFIKNYKGDKFDYIIFFEVLEHLENPGDFMINLKDIVKNTGKIFFSVPNRERIFAHRMERDSPPHHLTRWSGQSLKKMLSIYGYCADKITISPFSADDALRTFKIYFGTLYFKEKIKKGCTGVFIVFFFRFLFKVRVGFYKILAAAMRIFTKRGYQIYIAAHKKTNGLNG
jgi:SAM-dependent methyltransferase